MTVNLRTEDSVESLDVGSALRHCVVAMHRRGFLSRGLVNAIKTAERSLLVLLHTAFHTRAVYCIIKRDVIEYYGATRTKQEVAKGARISKIYFWTTGDPCVFKRE